VYLVNVIHLTPSLLPFVGGSFLCEIGRRRVVIIEGRLRWDEGQDDENGDEGNVKREGVHR